MKFLAIAAALGMLSNPSIAIRDVGGIERRPLHVLDGKASVLFFITHDCPISNHYAREIRRVCDDYGSRGVTCSLVYVDPSITDAQARAHAAEYGHGGYPAIVDRRHELVRAIGVTVTPEVGVVMPGAKLVYRGRIDDLYVSLGQKRRQATTHDLREALDAIVAGRPVARPTAKALGCYIPDLAVLAR